MKPIIANFLLAAVCLVLSCENKNPSKLELKESSGIADVKISDGYKLEGERTPSPTDSLPGGQTPPIKKQDEQGSTVAARDWDKKIIKTGVLNAEVKNYKSFQTAVREKVSAIGGYISQEEQTQSDYKIENSLVIKVPVEQFDIAIAQLSEQTEKVNEKKITSQDVTMEMVDTRSRMEAKKQVRLRYLDLLKQAKNMEEILNVQTEINGIQEQIESAAGRLSYLGNSSTYSTINLTYYQVLNAAAIDEHKPSFGRQLSAAFSTGWEWTGQLFVGLVSIWPLLLLFWTVFILYKRTRNHKPKQAA
jgi:hypothetical protein